jgi:hypothetical protein
MNSGESRDEGEWLIMDRRRLYTTISPHALSCMFSEQDALIVEHAEHQRQRHQVQQCQQYSLQN